MKPSKTNHRQGRLFETRLSDLLKPSHELLQLSEQIDWNYLEQECSCIFTENGRGGQPPKPVRLMLGLLMLEHMHNLSDEEVVARWIENPYWQRFCGYDYLQWEKPIDPTSLTRWRQRLGKEHLEKLLQETINVALRTKTIKRSSMKKVIGDTTVMEKNIAFPTDGKLYDNARKLLVKKAEKAGISLRQNYNRISKKHLRKIAQYSHAKQYKRMRKEIKKMKVYLRRIVHDIRRKWEGKEEMFQEIMPLAEKLLTQEKRSKEKLYSLYHPEVECISKGKAHKKYEFGCKTSVVITHKEGLCLSIGALHGNPYDGHTINQAITQAEKMSQTPIEQIFLDRGYKGAIIEGKKIYRSGQKKGITAYLKRSLKRRQAIEPRIGHMKRDGKLARNYLKGKNGNENNAILVGVAYNLRMILRKLRIIFAQIIMHYMNRIYLKIFRPMLLQN